MKSFNKFMASAMACLLLSSGFALTSCNDDDDDFGTNQYVGGVTLNVFGPTPVARGGELRFLGSGMNQISSITLPGSGDITDIQRISNEEIRITVPQDAMPGKIVLHHAGGDITTTSELTFTEPISIESVSPLSVRPGDLLTIKGDYLNLIHEVIFTDEAVAPEETFTKHERHEICVVVPDDARTGKIIISDGAEMPNWIYSDEEVQVALPSVDAVADLTKAKPGQEVSIKGKNLDLVRKVVMPNEDEVEFTVKGDVITFVLPADVTDGTICILPGSGVKVAAATIGVAVPEEVVAVPATDIWGGDVIKIKGVNMELVTVISFPGVDADPAEPDSKSATELTVTLPTGIQSGDIVLHTNSGAEVNVPVQTLKPGNILYAPVPAALAGTLTVKGINLHNVVKVRFNGDTDADVSNPQTGQLQVTVPATLAAGQNSVAFILSNGEVVDGPSIELTAPECAYATVLPGEDVEIHAGETVVFTIANESHLTGVKVNGSNVQYILNGTRLIIQVPESCGKTGEFTLVSDNGQISYTLSVIPATHVENVIMNETRDLGSWAGEGDGGAFRLYKESFEGVPAGAKLVFHISPYAYTQIQLNDANWGQMDMLVPAQTETLAEWELTQERLDRIRNTDDGWSTTGMVVQGEGCVVSKVHIEWENALEVSVFGDLNVDLGSWSINYELKPADAFVTAGLREGMNINFYLKPTADYCQMQLFDGHWGGLVLPETGDGTNNFNSDKCDMNKITIKATADVVEKFTTLIDWGYCGIVQGENCILQKITIE